MASGDLKIALVALIKKRNCHGIRVTCCTIPNYDLPYLPCPFGSSDSNCSIDLTDRGGIYNESIKKYIELYGLEDLFDLVL